MDARLPDTQTLHQQAPAQLPHPLPTPTRPLHRPSTPSTDLRPVCQKCAMWGRRGLSLPPLLWKSWCMMCEHPSYWNCLGEKLPSKERGLHWCHPYWYRLRETKQYWHCRAPCPSTPTSRAVVLDSPSQTGSLWLGHRCYKQMLQDWNPTSVSNSVLFLLYPTALNKM